LSALDEDAEVDEEEGLLASTGRRFNATIGDITGRIRGNPKQASGVGTGAAGRPVRGDYRDDDAEE